MSPPAALKRMAFIFLDRNCAGDWPPPSPPLPPASQSASGPSVSLPAESQQPTPALSPDDGQAHSSWMHHDASAIGVVGRRRAHTAHSIGCCNANAPAGGPMGPSLSIWSRQQALRFTENGSRKKERVVGKRPCGWRRDAVPPPPCCGALPGVESEERTLLVG